MTIEVQPTGATTMSEKITAQTILDANHERIAREANERISALIARHSIKEVVENPNGEDDQA